MRRTAILLPAVFAAALLLACGSDAPPPGEPTPTAPPVSTPTAPPVATGVSDARDIDFTDPALIGPVIDRFGGGEIPLERVLYVDITGDGVEEAVVVVESGGTLGDLGAAVFEVRGDQAFLIGTVEGPGRVEVRFGDQVAGLLAVMEGIYGPGEPSCCPSRLRERIYQWDGLQLALVIDQVIDNPNR